MKPAISVERYFCDEVNNSEVCHFAHASQKKKVKSQLLFQTASNDSYAYIDRCGDASPYFGIR